MPSEREEATPERIVEMLQAFERTEALRTAIELGLFSALGGSVRSLPELAKSTGASERGLRALLHFLASVGLIEKTADGYRAAADAARYLDRASSEYLGDAQAFYTSPTLRDAFRGLPESVRRGGSDPASIDSMRPDHPVWPEYARAMAPLFAGAADSLARLLLRDDPAPRSVLDVAAGHGLFGIAIARRAPTSVVTALDWAAVLPAARRQAEAAGVSDRYLTRAGDAFTADLGGPHDLLLAANFLHHFDPAGIGRLLDRFAAALAPAGRIGIVEFVPNEDRVSPPAVARFGLSMVATTTTGDVYTFDELAALLVAHGFDAPTLHPLARSPERAVLARRR